MIPIPTRWGQPLAPDAHAHYQLRIIHDFNNQCEGSGTRQRFDAIRPAAGSASLTGSHSKTFSQPFQRPRANGKLASVPRFRHQCLHCTHVCGHGENAEPNRPGHRCGCCDGATFSFVPEPRVFSVARSGCLASDGRPRYPSNGERPRCHPRPPLSSFRAVYPALPGHPERPGFRGAQTRTMWNRIVSDPTAGGNPAGTGNFWPTLAKGGIR